MTDKLTKLGKDYKEAWEEIQRLLESVSELYGNGKKEKNNNTETPIPHKNLTISIPKHNKKGGGKIMYGYKKGGKV